MVHYKTKLEQIMIEEGRSQTWLAKQVGVSPNQVNRWVKGIHEPTRLYMKRIAEALGRPVEGIFFTNSVSHADNNHAENLA